MAGLEKRLRKSNTGEDVGPPIEIILMMHERHINKFGKTMEKKKEVEYDREKYDMIWKETIERRNQKALTNP